MEYKLINAPRLAMKAASDAAADSTDLGTIEGYGSTFGDIDSYNERVLKGAFADTIEEFVNDGFIAFAHNWGALPVATPTSAAEDDTGLKFAAEYHSTDEAQAARTVVRERLERKKSVKLSIGYEVLEDKQGTDKVRELVKLRLFEISIVTVPANVMATVTEAKSGKNERVPHAGFRLKDHSEWVHAANEEYIERLEGYLALRVKEGREFSAANLAELDEIIKELESARQRAKALRAKVDGGKGIGNDAGAAGETAAITPERTPEEKQIFQEFRRLKYQRIAQGIYTPTE